MVAPGDEAAAHAALKARGLEAWTVGAVEQGGPGEATCEVVR
jgi:phosphoribosylformylglycinamidine cyclo-ligase